MSVGLEVEVQEKIKNLHIALLSKIQPKLTLEQTLWLQSTEIIFNKRLRTSLGRAHLRQNQIELNPRLIQQHPEELEPTFVHELAHLVAPLLFGRLGFAHRVGWRKVMIFFGYPAERTHRLPVAGLRWSHRIAAKAICGCKDFTHEIKPRRFKKMRYGRRRYRCLKCQNELKLIREPLL